MCPLLPKVYVCLLLCSPPFTPIRLVTVVPACGGPAGRGFPLPWFSPPKPPLNSSCLFRLLSYLLLHPCHPPIRTLGLLWIPAISDRCSPIPESPDPIHLLLNEPPILYDPLHVPYPGFLCRAQPSTFHQSMGVSYHVPPRYFAWALFLFSRPFLVLALAPATLLINYMCPGFHARTPFWTPSYPYLITSCPHIFGLV